MTSPDMAEEPFTMIERSSRSKPHQLFDDVVKLSSGLTADHDFPYVTALRESHKGLIVTGIPATNVNLLSFANAGFATYERDTKTDSFASWRGYVRPFRRDGQGQLGESVHFAKYNYHWGGEDFILYTVANMQYVLKEKRSSENALGPSKATDALIQAAGDWVISDNEVIWVYDGYWRQDKLLYKEVQKASWDKVILDEKMKKELTQVTETFFSSKQVYEDLGVPWKRGLMFHGPPGNGKTVSIKALMHSLLDRKNPIPTLYVKSAPYTYNISQVFAQARTLAPCMLILEDIETIVTTATRSYFFNEMDGLAGNDGLFVVASTNYLDRLDPGLTNRPSRFDRKYLFPEPNEHERALYCEYWRQKLKSNPDIEFPKRLTGEMAKITDGFSFAFLQECFVASLLVIAGDGQSQTDADDDDLERFRLWKIFKEQAEILRGQLHGEDAFPLLAGLSLGGHDAPSPFPPLDGGDDMEMLTRARGREVGTGMLPDLGYTGHKITVFNQSAFETRAP